MTLKYWDEAFLAATYLINHLCRKILQFATPLERLFHENPNYEGLRTFGCACWPNLCPFNTHKLQFHSKQCVFLGYSNMYKWFKCLDVAGGRVYISRDVIFDETIFPFSKLNPNADTRLRSKILYLPIDSHPPFSSFHVNEFLDGSNACVPVNLVSINGICLPGATKKNLGEIDAGIPLESAD
jgi:hypothetical protein